MNVLLDWKYFDSDMNLLFDIDISVPYVKLIPYTDKDTASMSWWSRGLMTP